VAVASRNVGSATLNAIKIGLDDAVLQGSKTSDSLDDVSGLKAQISVTCFQGSAQLRRYLIGETGVCVLLVGVGRIATNDL